MKSLDALLKQENIEQVVRNIVSVITSLGLTNQILFVLIKNHSNIAEIQDALKACRKG